MFAVVLQVAWAPTNYNIVKLVLLFNGPLKTFASGPCKL